MTYFHNPNLNKKLNALNLNIDYHQAKGCYLFTYDKNGEEIKILDLVGGYGSSLFGHNHPQLYSIAKSHFANQKPFIVQGSKSEIAQQLSEKLNDLLFQSTKQEYNITYGNSGAEAVESAIKHCIWRHENKVEELRNKNLQNKTNLLQLENNKYLVIQQKLSKYLQKEFQNKESIIDFISKHNRKILSQKVLSLSLKNAFHGKTKAALDVTSHKGFKNKDHRNKSIRFVKPNHSAELESVIQKTTNNLYFIEHGKLKIVSHCNIAYFILEPIQGEAGVLPLQKEYIETIHALKKRTNLPVIADEIQCGMGRTGTFLFAEQIGLIPDYVLLSKSLGGGMSKISAMCCRKDWYGNEFDLKHSSTFAGDNFSCAIALESLNLLQSKYQPMERCNQLGKILKTELQQLQKQFPKTIKDLRGSGLMIGLEFQFPTKINSSCLKVLCRQNLMGYIISGFLLHYHKIRIFPCLSNPNTLRIQPAYSITQNDINRIYRGVLEVCTLIEHENIAELCKFIVCIFPERKANLKSKYQYPKIKNSLPKTENNVAFVGHFIEAIDLQNWDESFKAYSEETCKLFLQKTAEIIDPILEEKILIHSITGKKCTLHFIGLTYTSAMISDLLHSKNLETIRAQLHKALEMAKTTGATMLGLGGYSSIVSNNGKSLIGNGISITTGNTLTVAAAIHALKKEANERQVSLSDSTLAIVGAGGNIGSLCALELSKKVKKVILIGSKKSNENLQLVANQINKITQNKNKVNIGTLEKLHTANLIICASNASEPIVFPQHIGKQKTIICDVAVPADTSISVGQLSNVKCIFGGLVNLHGNPEFKIKNIQLPKGIAYACMTETILLGLENYMHDFSIGDVKQVQITEILELVEKHSFDIVQKTMQKDGSISFSI